MQQTPFFTRASKCPFLSHIIGPPDPLHLPHKWQRDSLRVRADNKNSTCPPFVMGCDKFAPRGGDCGCRQCRGFSGPVFQIALLWTLVAPLEEEKPCHWFVELCMGSVLCGSFGRIVQSDQGGYTAGWWSGHQLHSSSIIALFRIIYWHCIYNWELFWSWAIKSFIKYFANN